MKATKHVEIKPLNPKGADFKYIGGEPTWKFQPTEDNRKSRLGRAFNWYNYHYGKKEAKDMLAHWLQHNGRDKDAKTIRAVPDSQIRLTPAWVCRMNLMGLELSEHEMCVVDNDIGQMLKLKQEAKKPVVEEDTGQAKLTIQDHLREKIGRAHV